MRRDPCRSQLRRRPPAVRPGLGAIIACAAAASSPAEEGFKPLPSDLHLAENPLEIPLVGPGPLPVIETGIGERGPIRLLLDTGANQLILFRPVVEALKLETRGVEQKIDVAFGGSLEALKAARIDSLHLVRNGDAVGRLRALDALVVGGGPGVPGVETHGVLGTAVLPSVLLRIDYPGRKLRLETGALPSPDGREVLALGKDLTIAARVGARPLRLMATRATTAASSSRPGRPGACGSGRPRSARARSRPRRATSRGGSRGSRERSASAPTASATPWWTSSRGSTAP